MATHRAPDQVPLLVGNSVALQNIDQPRVSSPKALPRFIFAKTG